MVAAESVPEWNDLDSAGPSSATSIDTLEIVP
jgi:hypothetical protein